MNGTQMKGCTLRKVALACGGILHVPESAPELENAVISGIVTDSRKAEEGVLFAAIRGERADGHSFIPQVYEKGALCVITERELDRPENAWIRVGSTLQALKDIAEYYLQVLGIPVVGITGSVGKTSTKEMIASVLAQKYHVLKTDGNFNNELGLPLTVFRLREEHEIAALEMGISDFGEMHRLAKIARPDTCVITCIGDCHLEALGDRDGVFRAKTEIFDFLREDGHIVLNGMDERLRRVEMASGVKPVFFGISDEEGISFTAEDIRPLGFEGTACRLHTPEGSFDAVIPLPGTHMVMNALAAAAVGQIYGLSLSQIRAGIESLQPVNGRFHLIRTERLTIVDDCYNANPMSMEASLNILREVPGRRAAILGDMFELGENELAMHRQVGEQAARAGLSFLAVIGERSAAMAEAAGKTDPGLEVFYYPSLKAFMRAWRSDLPLQNGDTVLVKASHGMEFAGIVEELKTCG